jgi:hypothetical protein
VSLPQHERLPGELPGARRPAHFHVELAREGRSVCLLVCSSTLQEAMPALDLLFGIRDDHFDKMKLRCCARRCPLTNCLLKKVLVQSSKRKNQFTEMTFTPGQCRILATSGTRTNIEFIGCKFEDDGVAFLEALVARDDRDTGPAKLSIWVILPCGQDVSFLCLNQLNLMYLKLYCVSKEANKLAELWQQLKFPTCISKSAGLRVKGQHWSNPSGPNVAEGTSS